MSGASVGGRRRIAQSLAWIAGRGRCGGAAPPAGRTGAPVRELGPPPRDLGQVAREASGVQRFGARIRALIRHGRPVSVSRRRSDSTAVAWDRARAIQEQQRAPAARIAVAWMRPKTAGVI